VRRLSTPSVDVNAASASQPGEPRAPRRNLTLSEKESRVPDGGETRRLVISALSERASGCGDHGEWRLYDVTATDADGGALPAPLVTFERGLPLNQPIELQVRQRQHPGHGVDFRLKRPGGAGRSGMGPRVGEAEERIQALENVTADLLRRVEALERGS
jgi:hypothetical protein